MGGACTNGTRVKRVGMGIGGETVHLIRGVTSFGEM